MLRKPPSERSTASGEDTPELLVPPVRSSLQERTTQLRVSGQGHSLQQDFDARNSIAPKPRGDSGGHRVRRRLQVQIESPGRLGARSEAAVVLRSARAYFGKYGEVADSVVEGAPLCLFVVFRTNQGAKRAVKAHSQPRLAHGLGVIRSVSLA